MACIEEGKIDMNERYRGIMHDRDEGNIDMTKERWGGMKDMH
jgi:hypothetical protein